MPSQPSYGCTGYCRSALNRYVPLFRLTNVCVDEQRVHLGVDVLHHDLEAVEAASFRYLDFRAEALDEVLVDNAIGCCEECEDV